VDGSASEPDDDDVVIWHLPEHDDLDVYRVTKGARVIGEFTGRSIGARVFRAAIEQAESGRTVWLKTEEGMRRLTPYDPLVDDIPGLD
jgi:hypothetical protein